MFRRLFLAFFCAGALCATDGGPAFHWWGKLSPGQLVEIKGVNGAIYAEPSDGDEVEVIARKTSYRYDPAAVEIEVVESANGYTVCAVYPGHSGGCRPGAARNSAGNSDVAVNFTVRVPNGVRFVGRTVNGSIEADHLSADVEAYTVNGRIVLSTAGSAQANTVNGSIQARLGTGVLQRARSFSTVNGSVEVELPHCTNALVRARTVNGRIRTDFPLTIRRTVWTHSMQGMLGRGGPELKLITVNGGITLRRKGSPTV